MCVCVCVCKVRSKKVGPSRNFCNFIILSIIHSRQECHPLMLAYTHTSSLPPSFPYLANFNLSH